MRIPILNLKNTVIHINTNNGIITSSCIVPTFSIVVRQKFVESDF